MGFDRRFTVGLIGWIAALVLALLASLYAFLLPGLGAARIVAVMLALAVIAGLWRHVTRTNRTVAMFLDALRFGDTATLFDARSSAGFDALGTALNGAMARFRIEKDRSAGELRYLEALVDDIPVALLTIDADAQVTLANKAARRLFGNGVGSNPEDFASFGATFAQRLREDRNREELLLVHVNGRAQRVLMRTATLDRLGHRTRAVSIQPLQGTLDAVEMAAQTDLVRVLTHEILNSLTPVTSLAATAADLLADPILSADPRVEDARAAVVTLARRARGLSSFIDAYRAIAQPPVVTRRAFAARHWADELARIFRAESPAIPLTVEVTPASLVLNADVDLLTQVLINLLRNAAQAMADTPSARLALRLSEDAQSVVIEVEDNGPGVPFSLRQDIFLPFFTTRAAGTGVGLNLARQIIVAHGGTIDIVDAAQGGALFRIVF